MPHAFLSALEKAAHSYLHPLFVRLHFVPRHEVQALPRGIGDLGWSPLPSHQKRDGELTGRAGTQVLDSFKYAELFWDEA